MLEGDLARTRGLTFHCMDAVRASACLGKSLGVAVFLPSERFQTMNVLYIHQYFAYPAGGGGVRSYHVASALVARGHHVTVLTCDAMIGEVEDIPFEVVALSVTYRSEMSTFRRIASFAMFMMKSAWWILFSGSRNSYSVVYATSTPLTVALPARLAALVYRCPSLFEVRDLWPEMPIAVGALRNSLAQTLARALEKAAYKWSSAIVALSPPMAEHIHRLTQGHKPVVVATNFPTLPSSEPREPSPEKINIAYVGSFNYLNDVDYLVELVHFSRDLDGLRVSLTLQGRGPREEGLRARVSSADLEELVTFLPFGSKTEVAETLATADVTACVFIDIPEMEKNSSNKLFDSLGAGRPVLINYGGWQEELLESSGAGVRLPRDPSSAAVRLREWWRDNHSTASDAARRLAAEEYSRDLMCSRVVATIESVHRDHAG